MPILQSIYSFLDVFYSMYIYYLTFNMNDDVLKRYYILSNKYDILNDVCIWSAESIISYMYI